MTAPSAAAAREILQHVDSSEELTLFNAATIIDRHFAPLQTNVHGEVERLKRELADKQTVIETAESRAAALHAALRRQVVMNLSNGAKHCLMCSRISSTLPEDHTADCLAAPMENK